MDAMLRRAEEMGYRAAALTDTNGLYGALPFYKQAREMGIKPILGCELRWGSAPSANAAVLLARDRAGYSNLCKAITRRKLGDDFDPVETLARFHEGLHILTEDTRLAAALAERIARDRLWLWLVRPGRGSGHERRLFDAAADLGLGVAAAPDVYFRDMPDHAVHRVLSAVRLNTTVSRTDPAALAPRTAFLRSPDETDGLYRDCPDALANSRRIAEDCNLDLPLSTPIFPEFPLGEDETPLRRLRALCEEGLARRYPRGQRAARERLRHELEIIERLGFTGYFLFVWDILGFARERGISTIGRGSGASSIVSYLLGITNVDPLEYDIPFERFLHLDRRDCPDLDIDLCWIRRDEVIDSIYRRYGASKVAMVSTHNTFRFRGAFRDTAKAFGVSNEAVTRLVRQMSRGGADGGGAVDEETLRRVLRFAKAIVGFPRHLGIHCGGLVIGDKTLDHYVPLERAAKGVVITQYEKDAIEEIGLVKMDFLGNHGLTIRDETLGLVAQAPPAGDGGRRTEGGKRGAGDSGQRQRRGRGGACVAQAPSPGDGGRETEDGGQRHESVFPQSGARGTGRLGEIRNGDLETIAALREGRTLSCCQLESPAMRNLLRMLRVSSIKGLMQALALIRPGPASMGMKDEFVRRARGLSPARLPHPSLARALGDSYGVMLYEDDAMLVASALAGVSLREGDLLRKAIKKAGSDEALREVSRSFLSKAVANGAPRATAEEVWTQMAKFSSYSFCKAHAASYALLAYQLAYLKTHYPLPFMTTALNHHWGMYPKRVHLEEARRLGIRPLLPDVNRSGTGFQIEPPPAPQGPAGAIRVGLDQVRGLTHSSIERILSQRERRPFDSLGDFMARVRIGASEIEALILCGGFDFTGRTRPQLLWEAKTGFRAARREGARPMLFPAKAGAEPPPLGDYDAWQKLQYELEILELSVSRHPMAFFRDWLASKGYADSRDIAGRTGRHVRIGGILDAERETATRGADAMDFLTLEDEFGVFEVTVFPRVYARFRRQLADAGPYLVTGTVEEQYGAPSVNARRIERLGEAEHARQPRVTDTAGVSR